MGQRGAVAGGREHQGCDYPNNGLPSTPARESDRHRIHPMAVGRSAASGFDHDKRPSDALGSQAGSKDATALAEMSPPGRVDGALGSRDASAMEDLTIDDVKDIGIAAIRRVIGETFSDVEVHAEQDWLDRDVYMFTLQFPSEATWQMASHSAVKMMTAIIDDLWVKGDTRFPHVRLLSDGRWIAAQDAAAE